MYNAVMISNGDATITVQRINKLMDAKGMSAAQVCRAGGIDKATLSNILAGRRKTPSPKSLEQIAIALETTLDYLWGNTDDPRPSGAAPLPDFALDVIEAMKRLPRGENRRLATIARSLAEARAENKQAAPEDVRDLLLEFGDEIYGPEAVDQLTQALEAAERARSHAASHMELA